MLCYSGSIISCIHCTIYISIVLSLVIRTRHITSIAIPTLVSCRRNYPPVEGAHMALSKLST